MLNLVFISFCGVSLFVAGYYFGNQIGRTQHIRQHLSEVRKNRAQ